MMSAARFNTLGCFQSPLLRTTCVAGRQGLANRSLFSSMMYTKANSQVFLIKWEHYEQTVTLSGKGSEFKALLGGAP